MCANFFMQLPLATNLSLHFSSQTQAVALYPASTPDLGPQAGPPPYPAASNAPPPYPSLPALPLTDQSKSCICNQFA